MYIDDAQGTLNHKKEVFDLIYFWALSVLCGVPCESKK
jgi:hypothetical protein